MTPARSRVASGTLSSWGSAIAALFALAMLAACPPTAPGPVGPPPPPPVSQPPSPSGACAPQDCGPTMAMPNGKCSDGSMSGPTGQCVRYSDGHCGWEVHQCPPPPAGACVRTGCSSTICAEAGSDIMTTCDMRPEYECYRSAACERQSNGSCGWTASTALSQCLATATGKK